MVKLCIGGSLREQLHGCVQYSESTSFMFPSDVLCCELKQRVGVCRICDLQETWPGARHWCFFATAAVDGGWLTVFQSQCVDMHVLSLCMCVWGGIWMQKSPASVKIPENNPNCSKNAVILTTSAASLQVCITAKPLMTWLNPLITSS